ncbi:MAG: hypothetical protein E7401_05775 [Ruminococcaceae bacterium]|nr:hypothetical protein [Oscillospiraceae bacterium]
MIIKRTANAGVLLRMDEISVLLDGVCRELPPYLGTPDSVREELENNFPDVVAFTHRHEDHFDESFARNYETLTLRPVIGPEFSISREVSNLKIFSVPTRHIGKTDIQHTSFVIEGSECVWFMGDASPLELKNFSDFHKPDVIIVPYAYAISTSAWKSTKNTGVKTIVLLHLPLRENDPYGLWQAVEDVTQNDECLKILQIGQEIEI